MKNKLEVGKIEKRLLVPNIYFGKARWIWKRVYFKNFNIDFNGGVNGHIAIFGESGSGKSNLCKLILKKLGSDGIPFVLFDPHNEYTESAMDFGAEVYDAKYSGINLFDVEGRDASELAGMLKRIFGLGEIQGYELGKCINYVYKKATMDGATPDIYSLFGSFRAFRTVAKSSTEKNVLFSLEHRLSPLFALGATRNVNVGELIKKRSVFAMESLHTSEAQSTYVELFLKKIYSAMLETEKSSRVKFYVVIDEAEKLQDSVTIERLVEEGRKYGFGIILISQSAKAITKSVRSNASTFFVFYQREPEELNYLANLIAGGNELDRFLEVKKAIRELGRGQAIAIGSYNKTPVIIRTKLYASASTDLRHRILKLCERPHTKSELRSELMREGYRADDIDYFVSTIDRNTLIKSCYVNTPSTNEYYYITMPRNSAEHDIYVALISRYLTHAGIKNNIYNRSNGPDIIAFYGNEKAAVEYETGSKSSDETIKMVENRLKHYKRVIFVVSDQAYGRYAKIKDVHVIKASEFDSGALADIIRNS